MVGPWDPPQVKGQQGGTLINSPDTGKSDNKSAPRVDGFFASTEQAQTKDSSDGGRGGESPRVRVCNSDNKINGCGLEGERISEQPGSVALKPSHAFGQMLLSSTGKGPKFLPIPL